MNFGSNNMYEIKPLDPKMKKKLKSIIIAAAVLIFSAVLIGTSVYMVTDQEQAVVLTFGRHTNTVDAGLHFKLPFGIQEAIKVRANVIHSLEIGYRTNPDGSTVSVLTESKMITGDMNIINVDFFLEYRISDPVQYLFASENPEYILRNLTQSRIRDVISSNDVDDVLTIKKTEIQMAIRNLITEDLNNLNIGLSVSDLRIQDSDPADPDVTAAFRAVETARQNRETYINEARAYRNGEIPLAEAERDQLLRNAELSRQDRVNAAVRQVAMFEAMFKEYERSPNVHRQRMYYEMIERVLPGVKLYINTSGDRDNGSISMILPLDDFMSSDN
ncbi:MAG: FtsH protease activity modulator HflK [Oscillospiraceae bacterium]|nr:FtsH protease activity modulator HflK [Oscillospiraceae bacterium]